VFILSSPAAGLLSQSRFRFGQRLNSAGSGWLRLEFQVQAQAFDTTGRGSSRKISWDPNAAKAQGGF